MNASLAPARQVAVAPAMRTISTVRHAVGKVSATSDNAAPALQVSPMKRVGQALGSIALTATLCLSSGPASARLEGVNRPELLPSGPVVNVIDVAGFLTDGEEARIAQRTTALERDLGIKLRVLAQNYPETPGLAIRDYWGVDPDTVVFVADPSLGGNILNFNVGENVDLKVPRTFWSRLSGQYGTKFYWQQEGEDVAIVNAVAAIDNCLREEPSRLQCNTIRGELE